MKKHSPRAEPFIATRLHHLQETAEDYVEIVADLISQKGEARTCDIADQLGVSHVTVVKTLKRLEKKGYLVSLQHQPITLTFEGEKLAKASKQRHQFLFDYLVALGVPEEVALIDVEGIEHHISPLTLDVFKKHLEFLKK